VPARSAGLIPYRLRAGHLEVLIAHMGGPYWARKDERAWSIVKGELDDGEEDLQAALREFEEETGAVPAADELIDLGETRQSGGKTVRAWAVEAELDASKLRSNTFELEWPPRSGQRREFPELDRYEWCPPEVASRRLVAAQTAFIEALQARLED
jgi:predicted NUDIX family NTP pyrophosphohydrolase